MKLYDLQTFNPDTVPRGALVDHQTVQAYIDTGQPNICGFWTAQAGRPWGTRHDDSTGAYRNTFITFRRAMFPPNTWKYCGDCFEGETRPRGISEGNGGAFFSVSEGRYLRLVQTDPDGHLTVKRIDNRQGAVYTDIIYPAEFISLINYFYGIKSKNLYHKYINPDGEEVGEL